MAQWMGQGSGNTHLSKIEDREQQLRHAVDVYRSKKTLEERLAYSTTVIRFADRLLDARIRAAKAHMASLDPRDDGARERMQKKIERVIQNGTNTILEEFNAIDAPSDDR